MWRNPRVVVPIAVIIALVGFRLVEKRLVLRAQAAVRKAALAAPPVVSVAPVEIKTLTSTYEGLGSVDPPLSVELASQVSGRVTYLAVHEGDRVSPGQVLVRIDSAEVEAEVRQAQGALSEAQWRLAQAETTKLPTDVSANMQLLQQQAGLTSAQADLTNARARYERQEQLYQQGFIAAQDVDDARTAVEVQQAVVEEARSALEFARANLAQKPAYEQNLAALRASVAQARDNLAGAIVRRGYTTLKAPLDGFVTGRFVDPGAMATPGQPLLAVQYLRRIWVTLTVPADVAATLQPGRPAQVTLATAGGQASSIPSGSILTGSVIQLNPSADKQSRQFTVRIGLDNPGLLIKPGMFAHVVLETGRQAGALVVPREAIRHDDRGDYVMVVENGKAARRPVTTGMAVPDVIAITEGLRPGEQVVTLSALPLRDGQAVATEGKGSSPSPASAYGSGAKGR